MSIWLIALLAFDAIALVAYLRWGAKQPPLSEEELAERVI